MTSAPWARLQVVLRFPVGPPAIPDKGQEPTHRFPRPEIEVEIGFEQPALQRPARESGMSEDQVHPVELRPVIGFEAWFQLLVQPGPGKRGEDRELGRLAVQITGKVHGFPDRFDDCIILHCHRGSGCTSSCYFV